jgi:aspartyl-tRNA(Asn)/glutamyl-tRNA(Gln) amidotransferase subunit A
VGNGHAPRVTAPGAGGDLRFASVGELAAALRNGETTSVALVERYLAAADRLDPVLGTYVRRFDEAALAAAAAADAELAAGHDRGPLHGIPVGVKDILATDDGPTTAQSMALEPAWGRGGDGPVVRRLRAGGAIVIGKTQMMEFAIGYPDRRFHATETGQPGQPFRLPRNPWNPDHWTGGSSSGTGNGVAAGLFPMGIGTDTGGSIRLPAAYCGVTGHKPTFGLVPKNGCVPLGFSYDHIGPLARTVADCAAFLGVVAGADPGDPYAQPGPPVDYLGALGGSDGSLAGLRVGVARSVTVAGPYCTSGVAEAFEAAVTVLAEAGATVLEVEFPLWAELTTSCFSGFFAEALAWHRDRLATRWEDYGSDTRLSLAQGALLSAADLAQIQRVRGAGRRAAAQLFGEVDLVVTPTAGTPAFAFGASADRELRLGSLFTPVYNALGLPALAVPMGFEVGLPVSLQIAGPWFADGLVLRVGHAYQQRTAWHIRVPELAIDPARA